jgi:ABC-type branched-subunit amino acid transport system substrate-binding protein
LMRRGFRSEQDGISYIRYHDDSHGRAERGPPGIDARGARARHERPGERANRTRDFGCTDWYNTRRFDIIAPKILYREVRAERPAPLGGPLRFSRLPIAAAALLAVAMIGATISPAGAQKATPKADDVGITAKEIRVAVIADVDTPVQPGLFRASVDAMKAWATVVNKAGGIAGRKIVIDFIDSKLNPNETRNAIIKACADDFAMVGGEALFLNNVDDMVACKNAAGEAIGIPDMPGNALDNAQACSPVTYVLNGRGSYCATKNDHPQTYTALQGDYLYYLKKNKDLHGIWTIPADLQATKNAVLPTAQAGVDLGIEQDGKGFYEVFSRDPQSAMTPIVQAIKQNNSNFAYNGGNKMADLRKEAALQGVTSVKVWACNQACYDNLLVEQGGADVNDTQIVLTTLPFYSEYKQNPTLKKLVAAVGGISKVDFNAVSSWIGALLFQDAATKATANGGTLSRQSLFDALKQETKFDAGGITGPVDYASRQAPRCIVMTQIKNGKFVRTYPKKVGTFDCNKKNLVEMKLDLG